MTKVKAAPEAGKIEIHRCLDNFCPGHLRDQFHCTRINYNPMPLFDLKYKGISLGQTVRIYELSQQSSNFKFFITSRENLKGARETMNLRRVDLWLRDTLESSLVLS